MMRSDSNNCLVLSSFLVLLDNHDLILEKIKQDGGRTLNFWYYYYALHNKGKGYPSSLTTDDDFLFVVKSINPIVLLVNLNLLY